jgi:hypothetical protein
MREAAKRYFLLLSVPVSPALPFADVDPIMNKSGENNWN